MAITARKIKVYFKLTALGLILIYVLLFLILNREKVELHFVFAKTRRLPIFLFALSMMGFGVLLYRVRKWISKIIHDVRQMRRDEKVRQELVDEVKKESKGKTNS